MTAGSVDYKVFDFSNAWDAIQRNTLYVKIDDDVVRVPYGLGDHPSSLVDLTRRHSGLSFLVIGFYAP